MGAPQEILASELLAGDPSAPAGEEVRQRMEAAFADCARRGLPVSVLFVEVTRLERQARELGVQPAFVRHAVVELLRHDARKGDLFACEEEAGMLVMLANTELETAELVCRQTVDAAKKLAIASLAHPVRVGLGVGLASTGGRGALLFEALVLVAREGAAVARQRGGECFVHTMLYEVMQTRAEKIALAAGKSATPPGAADVPSREEPRPSLPEVRASAAAPRPPTRPVDGASGEARALPAEEEVDILRRRIAKLSSALEASEKTLAEVCARKGVVPGIASTYREVQGLDPAEPARKQKQELLEQIFAANLELQRLRQAQAPDPAAPDHVQAAEPELVPSVR